MSLPTLIVYLFHYDVISWLVVKNDGGKYDLSVRTLLDGLKKGPESCRVPHRQLLF